MRLLFSECCFAAAAIGLWHLRRHFQRVGRLFATIGAVALASMFALLMLLFVFGGAMCGRYDFSPVSSPDGLRVASVSEEDCGAVDSFHSSVQLSRRERGGFLNAFRTRVHSATVFRVGHDPRLLELKWKGANVLIIRYPNDSRSPEEFGCQSEWDNVQIECVGYAPDYSKRVGQMPPVRRWFR